ncbi:putative membrane protein [Eubacterium ruminantium]|nr:putative membrane protein [Eubacterium ruminantium]
MRKRIVSTALCAAMLISLAGCARVTESKVVEISDPAAGAAEKVETEKEEDTGEIDDILKKTIKTSEIEDSDKDETVYIIADATGAKKDVIVSEWLKNKDKADVIKDISDLTDIENVKGDETFTQDGNEISWQANGNPIYYQGKTDKEIPVELKITYYLDGEEVTPEQIAGKSGSVKIRFEYINKSKKDDVYTPFIMATGFFFDNTKFSNVSVENGKYVSDGNKSVVIGFGLPGLEESLAADTKKYQFSIPDYFEVTADTTDFKLDMTLTIAATGLVGDSIEDVDLSTLEDKLNGLLTEYQNGVNALVEGISSYTAGVNKVADGASQVAQGAQQLKDGSSQLYAGGITLSNALESANIGAGQLKGAFEGESGILAGSGKISEGLNTLNEAVQNISLPTIPSASEIQFTEEQKKAAEEAISKAAEAQLDAEGVSIDLSELEAFASMTDAEKAEAIKKKAEDAAKDDPNVQKIIADENVQGLIANTVDGIIEAKVDEYMASEEGQAQVAAAAQQYKEKTVASILGTPEAPSELAQAAIGGLQYQYAQQGAQLSAEEAYAALLNGVITKLDSDESVAETLAMLTPVVRSKVKENIKANYAETIKTQVVEGYKLIIGNAFAAGYGNAYLELGTEMQDIAGKLEYIIKVYANQGVMFGLDQALTMVKSEMTEFGPKIDTLKGGVAQLSDGSKQLDEGLNQLYAGNASLSDGLAKIYASVPTLTSGLGSLSSGADQLSTGASQLSSGAAELDSHSKELVDGSKQLKGATDQIVVKFGDATDKLDELAENAKKIITAGKEYNNFAGLSDDMKGNVKFIIKTAEISAE